MASQQSSSSSPVDVVVLPEEFQKAMDSMRWELEDPQPMKYVSLEELAKIRTTNALKTVATLRSIAPITTTLQEESKKKKNVNNNSSKNTAEHLARIATALLLLGQGCADEAHDLVLTLSWRGDLPYAYQGPPQLEQEQHDQHDDDEEEEEEHVQTLACYAHCLVHRLEGPHASEFGMTGFQNSNYWAGHAMRNLDGILSALPLPQIRNDIMDLLLADHNTPGKDAAAAADNNGTKHYDDDATELLTSKNVPLPWDPRCLTELCRRVVETNKKTNEGSPTMHPLKDFAEKAAVLELKHILRHTLSLMGFSFLGY
jgi:hypothetical protein